MAGLTGTGSAMGDAIVTAMEAIDPFMTTAQINQLKSSWESIGTVMINWIVANAVVKPTSMTNTAAIPVTVSVSTGVGATTAAEPILGTGTVV